MLFLGVLVFNALEITDLIVWSLFFTFLKLEILLAIVFFLSSFMSNIMTILISLMVYLISHSFSLILDLFYRLEQGFLLLTVQMAQLLFPPLEALNTKDVISMFNDFSLNFFLYNTMHAMLYITLLLMFAVIIFSRKTFED